MTQADRLAAVLVRHAAGAVAGCYRAGWCDCPRPHGAHPSPTNPPSHCVDRLYDDVDLLRASLTVLVPDDGAPWLDTLCDAETAALLSAATKR